ncbi:hypothetical protein CA51_50160 [Rosistilla oblonga]|uniref:hypothetical protein n=1 Tax=Rosistilla oblonga TaxID=2527990 RepID=UPI0011880DCD|nr:hypothetical protein [Rosistilla oblonga]QDV15104.1 hypothetical protein CA51_50160 [Rosistilla oblonga]
MSPTKPKRQLLPPMWQLPEEFRHRLGSTAGRQRAMLADGHLLLVLHVVPGADDTTRTGRFFWRETSGTWHSSDSGAGPAALHKHLDQYAAALDASEQRETEALHADQYLQLLERLSPLLRASRNMLQVLEEARKEVPQDRDLIECRDRAYEISRTAELLYGDAKNAMDVAVVRRAEQQAEASDRMARASHRLNVLLAMFFPIATLAAMFSTVFTEGWRLSDSPLPFVMFVGVGLLSGLLLTLFITRPGGPEIGWKRRR